MNARMGNSLSENMKILNIYYLEIPNLKFKLYFCIFCR